MNKLHFGVKNRFLEIPVFLRIFRSGVVGATDTFVGEHVANCKTWGLHFSDNQRGNKTGGA